MHISLNHTLDSALLVEGFAKIVPVFSVPGPFVKKIFEAGKRLHLHSACWVILSRVIICQYFMAELSS